MKEANVRRIKIKKNVERRFCTLKNEESFAKTFSLNGIPRKNKKNCFVEIILAAVLKKSQINVRVTPSLPKVGEASQGEHPLDSHLTHFGLTSCPSRGPAEAAERPPKEVGLLAKSKDQKYFF